MASSTLLHSFTPRLRIIIFTIFQIFKSALSVSDFGRCYYLHIPNSILYTSLTRLYLRHYIVITFLEAKVLCIEVSIIIIWILRSASGRFERFTFLRLNWRIIFTISIWNYRVISSWWYLRVLLWFIFQVSGHLLLLKIGKHLLLLSPTFDILIWGHNLIICIHGKNIYV